MGRASGLTLEKDERRIVVIRRHWWLLVRPVLGLIPLLLALPVYAALDYLLPDAELTRYTGVFITVDLALSGIVLLKWLSADFASWYADSYVITNRRVIEQQGVLTVERREASLRAVQESNYTITGAEAQFFDYGDLRIQTGARGKGIIFRQVPHPRRIQTLLAAQARAARDELQRARGQNNEISAALTRIFNGAGDLHDAPTQAVPRITPTAVRANRRLNLLPGEAVVHSTRRHPLILCTSLFPPVFVLVVGACFLWFAAPIVPPALIAAVFVLICCWLLWMVLNWRDAMYVLTTDRIVELRRTPLLFEARNVAQLRAVQDVVLRVTLPWGRLFNMGALTIELGGADPLRLQSVPRPTDLQRQIFEGLESALQHDRLREQERLAGTLGEWFKEYHRMQEEP